MKKLWFVYMLALSLAIQLFPCTLQAATPAATTTKAAQPQTGGIYKVLMRLNSNVFGYPPRMVAAARDYAPPFFDHLFSVGDDGKYKPGLALSWDTAKDGKTITFKLRRGVTFHDGTPFNAQAVKANIDNLIPPKATIIPGITSVDVIDDYTVKLNLPEYNYLILHHFATNVATYMYSPDALQKNGEDWATTHPVGTGPFMLKDYQPNISITATKNPSYWQKGLPYLDGIVMSFVPDPMTQMMTLKSGQANAIYAAATTAATQLRAEGYPLHTAPGALYAMNFDMKNSAVFSNPKVRQAIEYAIDKEAICSGPGEGLWEPVYQIVSSDNPGYNKSCPPRKYDPATAKKLLVDAGYPDGFSFKILASDTSWKDGWVAIQSYLDKVGIKMEINTLNVSGYNLVRMGKIEKGTAAFSADNPSSNTLFYLDSFYRSDSRTYPYVVKPTGIDKLIDQGKFSRNPTAIHKINQQIMKLLYDDETVVPLYQNTRIVITDKSVQNTGWFIFGDADNNEFGTRTWLKK